MKPSEVKEWEDARRTGMVRYVLQVGVLQFGLIMFSVAGLSSFHRTPTLWVLLVNLFIWPIAGVAFGIFMWCINEYRYRLTTNQSGA